MEVKTNKEYQAMQHEIAAAQDGDPRARGPDPRAMEEAETLTRELKEAEAELRAPAGGSLAAERKALDAEAAALERKTSEETAERARVASRISAAGAAALRYIARQRRGLAVAEARDGICTVCHVRLRPQVFNEVRRNDDADPVRQLPPDPVLRPPASTPDRHAPALVIRAYIDGGARGNPGPAGYGARIETADGTLLDELHGGLGIATNNIAEYNGLLAALRWAVAHGERSVAHPCRLGAARETDARRVPREERGAQAAVPPGVRAHPRKSATSASSTSAASSTRTPIACRTSGWTKPKAGWAWAELARQGL